MSIRQKIARWLIKDAWDSSQIKKGSTAWLEMFGPANGLPALSEHSALTVSAINACVNLLAGCIASLPLNIYQVDQEGFREEVWGDPLWWALNEEMSPRWSAASGWEFLANSWLFHGNAYAGIIRDRQARPIGLDPWHPNRVEPLLDATRNRLVYSVDPDPQGYKRSTDAKRITYDQDDVIHIAGKGWDGIKGLSPLRYELRTSGASALATQEYAGNFFANSARPDYALVSQKSLSEEGVDVLRKSLLDRYQGPEKSHLPMILHSGMDVKTLSLPMKDLQLVEIRKFQVEDICRAFNVPPFMVGHSEGTTAWGTGLEVMGTNFVRFTLRPYLNKIENEFNRKLIRQSPKLLAFDTTDFERADMKTFIDGLRSAVGRAGERQLMSLNEARKRLRLKPTDGGDEIQTENTAAPAAAPNTEGTDNAQSQTA